MPVTVSTDVTGDEEIKGTVTYMVRVKNQFTNTNGTDTNTPIPQCTKVKELIKEYVRIYGHNETGATRSSGPWFWHDRGAL